MINIKKLAKESFLAVLRAFTKRADNNLHIVKIRMGPLKGKKMLLNLFSQNGTVDSVYLTGYKQEADEIKLLKKIVQKGMTIWDIGIYRGFYTLLFSDLVGYKGKIITFDIDEENCRVINQLIQLNNIENIVTNNYGLSNQNEVSEFISSPSSNSRLLGTFRGYYTESEILTKGEKIKKVKLRTLDSLAGELGLPDIIKVDIDGAELFALDTADKIFQKEDIIFIIESHNPDTDKKITEFLDRNNCIVYSINEKRFFKKGELYWGSSIASKQYSKLETLKNDA